MENKENGWIGLKVIRLRNAAYKQCHRRLRYFWDRPNNRVGYFATLLCHSSRGL